MRFGQKKFLVVMLVVVVATLVLGILYAFKESLVYVIVNYLPDDVIISNDPRVVRVTPEKLQEVSESREFNDGSDHLSLSLVEEQNNECIVISLVNIYDPLAAHGYVFTFEIKDGEIKGDGVLAWISQTNSWPISGMVVPTCVGHGYS